MQKLGDTTTLVIKLDRSLKERLQHAVDDRDMSRVVRELIEKFITDNEKYKFRKKRL